MTSSHGPEGASPPKRPRGPVARVPLGWLVALRWAALAGQLGTVLVAAWTLHLPVPLVPLATLLTLSAALNLALIAHRRRGGALAPRGVAAVLVFDAAILTGLLYFTGGVRNPFTSFYLVYVVMAAMTLPPRAVGLIVTLCGAGFAWLFFFFEPLAIPHEHVHHEAGADPITFDLHLQGMVVAFVLTSAWIAYFASRLSMELHRQEAELSNARLKAAQHERFAAVATLAAGVAHELGSPLGTIAVASRELERAAERSGVASLAEDARLIRDEVERCQEVLQRLNRRSTQGTGEPPEWISAQALLEALPAKLARDERDRLALHPPSEPVELCIPREAVEQALRLLVRNGLQASGPNGTVEIRTISGPRQVTFHVQDRGTGMPESVQARACEPFYTTKEPGHGMGLGLFIVRTLAEQLGGAFEIHSDPGRGTRASFTIPAANERPA